jgi:universal stress protein A
MAGIKTILVPVDFTDCSNRAADYAAVLARKFRAKIMLIHVVEPFTYSVSDTVVVTDHYAALRVIAERLIDGLQKKLSRGVKVDRLVTRGVPYVTIIDRIRKSRPDLVVMGTHGRTGFEHVMLGSVAERVVRLSPSPVLTVRGSERRRTKGQPHRRPLPLI